MKKFWLVLSPDSFLWLKDDIGLIYNSSNYKHFKFPCNSKIKKICKALLNLDNLYSADVTDLQLRDKQLKQWVKNIVDIKAGLLIENNSRNKKPISYYPFLKIQDDKNYALWENELNMGGEVVKNLNEFIFYINGSQNGSCQLYQQMYYPLESSKSLEFEKVVTFIRKCRNSSMNKITIIGDILNYTELSKLKEWIRSTEYSVNLHLLLEDINLDISKIEWFFSENTTISIIVNDYTTFSDQLEYLKNFSKEVNWKFPVASITQFELANSLIEKNDLKDFETIPIYNGNNKTFFEENIYMAQDDFKDIKLSKRQVFINMAMNIHYFGKLTVMPDGQVYADVNQTFLGDIDTPIYDMIFKEMTDGHSWLRVRDNEPCNNCVFQWLCPAPGNYEQVLNKPNMCHVFRQEENVMHELING